MATIISTSKFEVSPSASYASRWVARSHRSYEKKASDYYTSSCDGQTLITTAIPTNKAFTKTNLNSHTTTWQAQARSKLDVTATTRLSNSSLNTSNDINNNELQEKLSRAR